MKQDNHAKTTFHTEKGTFYYQKMLFGLKNVGATYQRLMDKIFVDQIGRNIEVYVDDMVIKILNEETLLHDVEETLKTLAKAHMRLNPTKCTFGIEEGQFLGIRYPRNGFCATPQKSKSSLSRKLHKTSKVRSMVG